jgi:hypothetical protein
MPVPVSKSAFYSMFTRGWSPFAWLSLSILSVLLIGAAPVLGQAPAASPAQAKAPMAHAAAHRGKGSGGMHEGIKVHGHWVIEVRKPNGRLISHTEFENNLYSTGIVALARFLFGGYGEGATVFPGSTVGEWGVLLSDVNGKPPCSAKLAPPFGNPNSLNAVTVEFNGPYCILTPTASQAAISPENCGGCSSSLQVGQDILGTQLVLSGEVVATSGGTISQVQTIVSGCGQTVSPSVCATETSPDSPTRGVDTVGTFTGAALPTSNTTTTPCGGTGQISCAVNVPEAGDTINVSVTLSFQ